MSFKETLVFLVAFAVLSNVADYFRLRWVVMANRKKIKGRHDKFFAGLSSAWLLVFLCAGFVVYTCYYAIKGFMAAYHSVVSTALAMALFLVCYDVLIRQLIGAIRAFRKFRACRASPGGFEDIRG